MNPDTATQFDIEVFQPFEVFGPRFYINVFSEQFRHVGDYFVALVGPLDQYLAVLFLLSAIDQLIFQTVADLDRVGDYICFACFQHLDQLRWAFCDLDIQFQSFRAGEILDQFVFIPHRLHFILKIGSRAV